MSGNSLRQTVHTHHASVHQAAKLILVQRYSTAVFHSTFVVFVVVYLVLSDFRRSFANKRCRKMSLSCLLVFFGAFRRLSPSFGYNWTEQVGIATPRREPIFLYVPFSSAEVINRNMQAAAPIRSSSDVINAQVLDVKVFLRPSQSIHCQRGRASKNDAHYARNYESNLSSVPRVSLLPATLFPAAVGKAI